MTAEPCSWFMIGFMGGNVRLRLHCPVAVVQILVLNALNREKEMLVGGWGSTFLYGNCATISEWMWLNGWFKYRRLWHWMRKSPNTKCNPCTAITLLSALYSAQLAAVTQLNTRISSKHILLITDYRTRQICAGLVKLAVKIQTNVL